MNLAHPVFLCDLLEAHAATNDIHKEGLGEDDLSQKLITPTIQPNNQTMHTKHNYRFVHEP